MRVMFQSAIEAEVTTGSSRAGRCAEALWKQVDSCDQKTNTNGQIKAGSVKAYAVDERETCATLPDLPNNAGRDEGLVGTGHALYATKGRRKRIDKLVDASKTLRKMRAFALG